MALDGVIIEIAEHPAGLALRCKERDPQNTHLPGFVMVIENPTVRPLVGDELWSTGNMVRIESAGVSFPYRRNGYSRLVQDWLTLPKLTPEEEAEIEEIRLAAQANPAPLPDSLPTAQDIISMSNLRQV